MTGITDIGPNAAKDWLAADEALLIDIREPMEFAREHIRGARLEPLSQFDKADFADVRDKVAVFYCRSGNRTRQAADLLAKTGFRDVYAMDGGIEAWKKAGLPIEEDRRAPIDIMRQVQITAGGLVLLGVVLGVWLTPWFLGLSAFVGAGLMFAGISGYCGMAKMLSRAPWNRAWTKAGNEAVRSGAAG
ncbi:MAG: rhodanese-like domain-containing protein [Alphaproteobacteria bacterium]|nr:rhodanese-like domain-containing protein [Alphaproteobacteria bacterium]